MQMYCFTLKLAALHFNENSNRPQATKKQGVEQYEVEQYEVVQPKYKKGEYLVRKVLVKIWICYRFLKIIYLFNHAYKVTLNNCCKRLWSSATWLGMSNQTEKIQNLCVLRLSDQTRQQQYSSMYHYHRMHTSVQLMTLVAYDAFGYRLVRKHTLSCILLTNHTVN